MAELWTGQLSLNGQRFHWILDSTRLEGFAPEDTEGDNDVLESYRLKDIEELQRGSDGLVFKHKGEQIRLRGQGKAVDGLMPAILQARPDCEFARRRGSGAPQLRSTPPPASASMPAPVSSQRGGGSAARESSADAAAGGASPEVSQKVRKTLSPTASEGAPSSPRGRQTQSRMSVRMEDLASPRASRSPSSRDVQRGGSSRSLSTQQSRLDFKRRSLMECEHTGPSWAAPTLQAIAIMLDEKHLRMADIFRHPHFNPNYLSTGDESLDAKEMHSILQRAGLELPVKDIANMISCIDSDGNGSLEINELEQAMRKFRRGTMIWVQPKEKVKKKLDLEHLHKLHAVHQMKLEKLEKKADQIMHDENNAIKQAKKLNRVGSRAELDPKKDYHPAEVGDRLYHWVEDLEQRHQNTVKKWEQVDKEELESRKIRPRRSASCPLVRREIEERNAGFETIGHRLHAQREESENRRRRMREEDECRLLMETDRIAQDVIARRGGVQGNRHVQLHAEHKEREDKRSNLRWEHIEAEASRHALRSVGFGKPALKDHSRIEELHQEHKVKTERRAMRVVQEAQLAKETIEKRAAEIKSKSNHERYKDVESKWASELDELPEPRPPKEFLPNSFGTTKPRFKLDHYQQVSAWCIESVDHALSTINSVVAARCNCMPDDRQFEVLQELVEPLQAAMEEYREAEQESMLHSEGAVYLKQQDSMRLFSDGRLLEDHVGWHTICEPDKLRQLKDDIDVLMEQAERAQAVLLAKVGPGDAHMDAVRLGKKWPKGAKWNHPAATKKAQFAINPGKKHIDAARRKAFVRYGPSESGARHFHVLDLARCCLVFVDATLLRTGLEQIRERFEVVDIRNYYNPDNTSLLGQKYVEVLVVVKIPEPFLCEIRLEEYCYFIARQRALPHIEKISEVMASLYSGNGADPEMIKYLSHHTLHKPKEQHSVSLLKKHLSHKFGSTVVAWRTVIGGANKANFNTFRRVMQELGQRHRSSEYWQALDATRAGCLSLFELDPDAVILLVKFYWRILGMATKEQMDDPELLFARLTSKSIVKLHSPGRLEAHEFRRMCKTFGVGSLEANRVFELLDKKGGNAKKPPVTLLPEDIFWLTRLPEMVNVECVMLKDPRHASESESLRSMTYSGRVFNEGKRVRTPAEMKRQSVRGSVRGSTVFARRSMSAERDEASRGSVCARKSTSARPSVSNVDLLVQAQSSRSSRASSLDVKRNSRSSKQDVSSPNSQGTTEPGRSPPQQADDETEDEPLSPRSARGAATSDSEANFTNASDTQEEDVDDAGSLLDGGEELVEDEGGEAVGEEDLDEEEDVF